jgi:hypothetical protein
MLWMAECMNDTEVSDTQRATFRRLLLTVPLRFRVIAGDEARLFAHVNLREKITGAHACMSRSAIQRVYEICQWRDRRAKNLGTHNATPASLALIWNEQVIMAGSSEPVTETFTALAFRLWEQLLCHDACRDLILWAERTWGKSSPFDTVMKMEAVVVKAKGSADAAEWLVASMIFYVQRGHMTTGELSVRNLTGKGSGNRGILDMWLFKRSVMLHISGTVLDSLEFTAGTKARASGALSMCSLFICHTFYNVFVIRIICMHTHTLQIVLHALMIEISLFVLKFRQILNYD